MVYPMISAGLTLAGGIAQHALSRKAAKARTAGLADTNAMLQSQFDATADAYNPLIEAGSKAQQLYMDAVGLNGPEAQSAFYTNFKQDPGLLELVDDTADATLDAFSGQGNALSGAAINAVKSNAGEVLNSAFNNRLSQLGALTSQGHNAINSLSGHRSAFAGKRAGALTGIGESKAGAYGNDANIVGSMVNSGNSILGRQNAFKFAKDNPHLVKSMGSLLQ